MLIARRIGDGRLMFSDDEVTVAGEDQLSNPEEAAFDPEHETDTDRLPAPPSHFVYGDARSGSNTAEPRSEACRWGGQTGHVTPYSFSVPDSPTTLVASLSVLTGPMAGQVYPLEDAETTIGSLVGGAYQDRRHQGEPGCTPVSFGRVPANFTWKTSPRRTGPFLDGKRVARARLFSGDRVHVGPNTSLRFGLIAQDEVALQQRLYESSTWDALTGTLTRHRLLQEPGAQGRRSAGYAQATEPHAARRGPLQAHQ